MSLTVKDLKTFLSILPDDYEVAIPDINFGGRLSGSSLDISDFEVFPEKRILLLPKYQQDYLD